MLFVYIWHRYRELMLADYRSRLAKGAWASTWEAEEAIEEAELGLGRGAACESLKWP